MTTVTQRPVAQEPVTPSPVPEYDEKLRVPLRWWALATMFTATFLLAFLVAIPLGVALASAGVLAALTAMLLIGYGSARVSVCAGVLRAGRASIPVALLRDPDALDKAGTRRVAGVEADARAFLLLRPYARGAVRVEVADPQDPTPYWLISTRRPERLASTLTAAIAVSRRDV